MSEKLHRIPVELTPRADQVDDIHDIQYTEIYERMREGGWTDSPTDGKAILLPDRNGNPAYEVLNPVPLAPPIGWTPTPPIEQLIADRVKVEVDRLRGEQEVDDIIDAEDFDIPDELPPLETIYEVVAMEPEAPGLKGETKVSMEEAARQEAEYLDLVEQQKLLRKRHREAAAKKAKADYEARYGDMLSRAPEPLRPDGDGEH